MRSSVLIVGAGLSGATLAERFASVGARVTIIDKRSHLAGNCFDHLDLETGIRVSDYGAHLFHTNSREVWDYLQQFAKWRPYKHQVLVRVGEKLLNLPINLHSINDFFDLKLQNATQMRAFLASRITQLPEVTNSQDYVLSQVGQELYEAIFRNYTLKQWALDPSELDASVIKRNPLRFNRDDHYFTDRYQALPEGGFADLVNKMLSHRNIKLQLSTDFVQFRQQNGLQQFDQIFYTGPIDQYFDYQLGHLEYRSLDFHFHKVPLQPGAKFHQANSVINYPSLDYPYTRVVEYKYFYPPELDEKTDRCSIISEEYPTWDGEPYYPVPRARNHELLIKYLREAKKLEAQGVYFVGRLGTYRYLNMDQAVAEALRVFSKSVIKVDFP